ncbi:MAG: hypothetical protein M3N12_01740, partial [Verrucomicrobiota bacterium]|nr:hypothetical protein [Verrucomicrobiota bacterium]
MSDELPEQKATASFSQALTGCTIVTRKTIPQARVLASSFKRFHPESRFFALLLDRNQKAKSIEGIEWISLPDLCLEPGDADRLPLVCNLEEMARALKPALLRTLLAAQGGVIACFDNDIKIFSALDDLAEKASQHSIVLFPISPAAADLKTYDPALIVIGAGSDVFLDWWKHLTRTQSYKNP